MENVAKESKEVLRKWTVKSTKSKVLSSPMTGSLKCRNILYVCSDNLERDIEDIWSKVLEAVKENQWHSVCFPVEASLLDDKSLHNLLSVVAKSPPKATQSRLELVLCFKEAESSLRTQLVNLCQTKLSEKFLPVKLHVDEVDEKPSSSKGNYK